MATLKLADYVQRGISLFLFGTTLFAGFVTFQNVRLRMKARSVKLEQAKKEVTYILIEAREDSQLRAQFVHNLFFLIINSIQKITYIPTLIL